jgi:solute carrier family 25 (mitochondrial adenine nucleotide translocator), member 4/5/6/31
MTSVLVHPKASKIKTSLTDAFAGAAAGSLAKTISAPIERIKLLKQLQHSVDPKDAAGLRGSAWSVAKTVYKNEGLLAFWRGNTPNVLQQAGTTALNFMFMDWYKSAINPIVNLTLSLPSNRPYEDRIKRRKMISSFLSGGLAGGTALTVLYPIAFLRTRLALDVGNHQGIRKYPRGMRDVFYSIMKTDGIKGVYQGYGIAISGVILYRAMHLGGYDNIKTELLHRRRKSSPELDFNDELTFMERFACAQIVSIVAGTMCYPIDSVRRRLMMQAGKPLAERKYKNSLHAFQRIFIDEGMRGFYLGIGPNLFRSFGGALLLVGYDTFKGMVG